jgi:MFS superfamily sulfate permease-like transporter
VALSLEDRPDLAQRGAGGLQLAGSGDRCLLALVGDQGAASGAVAERLSEDVLGLVNVADPPRWFVLQAEAIDDIDYTGAQTLLELADHLQERGIVLAVAEASDDLRRELDRFGFTDKIGPDRYFDSLQAARDAFHSAVRNA